MSTAKHTFSHERPAPCSMRAATILSVLVAMACGDPPDPRESVYDERDGVVPPALGDDGELEVYRVE